MNNNFNKNFFFEPIEESIYINQSGHLQWNSEQINHFKINQRVDLFIVFYFIFRVGRARYVDKSEVTDVDPGAYAVVIVLKTLVKALLPKGDHQCPI